MFVLLGLISNLPSYFRTLKPRKSKPSSMCVICVFSSERVKPLMAKKFLSAGLTVSSRNSFELLVIIKSSAYRTKFALSCRRASDFIKGSIPSSARFAIVGDAEPPCAAPESLGYHSLS